MNLQLDHGKHTSSKDKAVEALISLKNSFHGRQATNKKEHLDADIIETFKGLNQTMSRGDDARESECFPDTGKEEVSSPAQKGKELIQFSMRSSPSTSRGRDGSGLKKLHMKRSNTGGMRRRSIGAIGMNAIIPSVPSLSSPKSNNVYDFTEDSTSSNAHCGMNKKENYHRIKPTHGRRNSDGMLLQTLGINLDVETALAQPCPIKILRRRNSGYTMDTSTRGSNMKKQKSNRLVDYSLHRAPIQVEKTSPSA